MCSLLALSTPKETVSPMPSRDVGDRETSELKREYEKQKLGCRLLPCGHAVGAAVRVLKPIVP